MSQHESLAGHYMSWAMARTNSLVPSRRSFGRTVEILGVSSELREATT